jgi:hypothetical protein
MDWEAEYALLERPDSPHPGFHTPALSQTSPQPAFPSTSEASHPARLPQQVNEPPLRMRSYHGAMYHPQMHPPSHLMYPSQLEPHPFNNHGGFSSDYTSHHTHPYYSSHPSLPPMNQPPSVPTVLNQNGIATNVESTRGKRKRAPAGSRTGASNKRPRQTASATLESSTPSASCGVGPTSNAQSHRGDVENHDPNHPGMFEFTFSCDIALPLKNTSSTIYATYHLDATIYIESATFAPLSRSSSRCNGRLVFFACSRNGRRASGQTKG